jgi:hypothetical protein
VFSDSVVPGHAAIAALGAEPTSVSTGGSAAATAAAAAGGGRVNRQAAGVKREREAGGSGGDDDYVPRSATAANRVDLTEEVGDWVHVHACVDLFHECILHSMQLMEHVTARVCIRICIGICICCSVPII